MNERSSTGGDLRVAAGSITSQLVGLEVDEFAARHWGRAPALHQPDLPHRFDDLLSADSVDELVSQRGLRTPFLRVAKNGSTLPAGAFTAGGGVGAGIADQISDHRLVQLFADGSTLVLQALHRVWPPIIELCRQLATELGHPVQANAYVTPPQNQGFDDHYDVHDVFVLQIVGEKHWSIHEPVLPSPLRDQPWSDRRTEVSAAAAGEPVIDTVLRPGDCLYLPRGYLHAARALGGVSIHLTIGVHAWTRFTLAEEITRAALAKLATESEARSALPFGTDLGDTTSLTDEIETVTRSVADAVSRVAPDDLARSLQSRARDAARAEPIGPLRQLQASAELDETTMIRLRHQLQARLDRADPDGVVRLRSRAGTFALAAGEPDRLVELLHGHAVSSGSVGLDLVRRLLAFGLVVTDPG